MKNVRIEPRKEGLTKKIRLFDTAEALYVHVKEGLDPSEMEECLTLSITGEEYVEAEWLGCEFVYDVGGSFVRFDSVRLGKAVPTENASGAMVETYSGWVTSDDLFFADGLDKDAIFTLLTAHEDCYIDLEFLFGDDIVTAAAKSTK